MFGIANCGQCSQAIDLLCGFEINGHDVIADADAELRNRDVSLVSLVRIERGSIGKRDH